MQVATVSDLKNVTPLKTKAKADGKKVQASGMNAKGHALAALVVRASLEEMQAEEKRGEKRRVFITSMLDLDKTGHAAFREDLEAELVNLNESEKGKDVTKVSRIGGYSLNSYRVMLSNWKALSIGIEAGADVKGEDGQILPWEDVLTHCREMGSAIGALNPKKAGRKPLSAYEKAMRLVEKCSPAEQKKIMQTLAKTLGYEFK